MIQFLADLLPVIAASFAALTEDDKASAARINGVA